MISRGGTHTHAQAVPVEDNQAVGAPILVEEIEIWESHTFPLQRKLFRSAPCLHLQTAVVQFSYSIFKQHLGRSRSEG